MDCSRTLWVDSDTWSVGLPIWAVGGTTAHMSSAPAIVLAATRLVEKVRVWCLITRSKRRWNRAVDHDIGVLFFLDTAPCPPDAYSALLERV